MSLFVNSGPETVHERWSTTSGYLNDDIPLELGDETDDTEEEQQDETGPGDVAAKYYQALLETPAKLSKLAQTLPTLVEKNGRNAVPA
jgi:hypothetical protein